MQCTRWTGALLLAVALLGSGCNRGFYRRQADAEAYALIRQKANNPRWDLPDPTIQVKPESRMFDPFSADHPPLPPDDPTSAKLMQVVDDKRGYSQWHANGDTDYVESPDWKAYLPLDENGNVIVDSARAVTLALTHSTIYQRQREELYLSALDVSLQRFGFDTQMFSGFNTFWTGSGRLRGGGESSSVAELSSRRSEMTRLGATGSEWVVGMANSIMWQFAGPNTQSATSLINFSFLQPLLRGAGRDVILESLTQTERTLLANVRQMERFRQGFYLQITTGRNAGTGPQRGGNFLSAAPLGSGSAGGLLGLLRSQQTIRIQEFNVSSLRNVLDQFIEFRKAERLDALQLSQTEGTLYQSESRLLTLRVDYETQLDQFKRALGLPPDLPMVINDPFLRQFELIDDDNNRRQYQIAELKVDVGNVLLDASAFIESQRFALDPVAPEAADPLADAPERLQELNINEDYGIRWTEELGQKIEALTPLLGKISPSIDEINMSDMGRIRADIDYLRQVRPRRAQALSDLRDLVQSATAIRYDIETGILEDSSLENPDLLSAELETLVEKLAQTRTAVAKLSALVEETIAQGEAMSPQELYVRLDEGLLSEIPKQLTDLASISLEISLVQARARTDSIELPIVQLNSEEAIQIARCCRVDWMNARASLVDGWRGIEVVANELESQLDLVFDGSMGNQGVNPFRINYETGQLRAGLRFDSPITRLAERNQYRQQLIQYQRDRRAYYEYEDEVKRGLRRTIRDIELNKILFELSRRSIKVSVQQVEQSRLRLEEPPQGIGGGAGGGRSQLGSTTARDLTDALNRLQNDQNAFLGVWVTYEALRRDLNFDLGTMQLTDDGFWIDPKSIDASIGIGCGADQAFAEGELPISPIPNDAAPIEIQLEPIPIPNLPSPTGLLQPSSSYRPEGKQAKDSLALVGDAHRSGAEVFPIVPAVVPASITQAIAQPTVAESPQASFFEYPGGDSPRASLASSNDLFSNPPRPTAVSAQAKIAVPSSGPVRQQPTDEKSMAKTSKTVAPVSITQQLGLTNSEIYQWSARIPSTSDAGGHSRTAWENQVLDRR